MKSIILPNHTLDQAKAVAIDILHDIMRDDPFIADGDGWIKVTAPDMHSHWTVRFAQRPAGIRVVIRHSDFHSTAVASLFRSRLETLVTAEEQDAGEINARIEERFQALCDKGIY